MSATASASASVSVTASVSVSVSVSVGVRNGMMVRRGAYRSRPSTSAQRVDKRVIGSKMWTGCFYIGPGLSEIRHQTPDGQEARKPGSLSRKDRSTLLIISNPCCLQARDTPTMYIGGHPSLSPGPPSPAPVPRRACEEEKKKKKNFFPRWILIRRPRIVACQARANARRVADQGAP